jgi:hypothetical protein
MGGLDFAGGTPVHISSGTAALAISIFLGKRRGYGTERLAYKPHNTTYVVLGTVFLWFGWFGFNGGSALSANLRAAQACIVTNLAASVGGVTWMLWVIILAFQYLIGAQFPSGLPSGEEVECSRVLFWCYRWPRRHYPRVRFCWRSYVAHHLLRL